MFTTGRRLAKASASVASASITRAAAAAMSRFSFCAVSIRAGNSSALKFTHQLASGQTGACLSTTGAVKAWGTSPVRFRGVGLGVVQPAAAKASMLTERPRKIAFIECSSNSLLKPAGTPLAHPLTGAQQWTQIWREVLFVQGCGL